MGTLYLPAWKTKDGDRLVLIAKNWQCESWVAAHEKRLADFMFLIPFGLTGDGIVEIEVDKHGCAHDFPHVPGDHATLGPLIYISGPQFDAAMAREAA